MEKMTENSLQEQERNLKNNMAKIKREVLVMSGKGGVGKTTIAVNLAYGLAMKKHKVGILDVDIHGPDIGKMLGIEDAKLIGSEKGIEPVEVLPNLSAVSVALIGNDVNRPVIWRGPLKMKVIRQFLSDVNWGELDYLIIDSPPGTGDEPLSICQLIPDMDGAVIVTTPQDVAILDSTKSVFFARELGVPVIGIIENMSGFPCPHCGKEVDLFGMGGGEEAAGSLDVPFLGRIPFEPDLVKSGDSGKPIVSFKQGSDTVEIMDGIMDKVINFQT